MIKVATREKKFLLALAGVAGLVVIYLLAVEPFLRALGDRKKEARDRRRLLVEYRKKAGEREKLAEKLKKLEKEYLKTLVQIKPLRNYLVEGKEVVDFRKSLGKITDPNNLERLTTQMLASKNYGTYQEENAKITFNATWEKLGKLLYDFEKSSNLFFVRSLDVSGTPTPRQATMANNLRVNVDISRFTFSSEVTKKLQKIVSSEESGTPPAEEPPAGDFSHYAAIGKKDPFSIPATSLAGTSLKPLPMKLSLRGVTFRDGKYSALIRDMTSGPGEENYFLTGETITGYQIKEIFSDRVVLARGNE